MLTWETAKIEVVPNTKEERTAWYEQVSYSQPFNQSLSNWHLLENLVFRSMVLGWGWQLTEEKVETAIKRNAILESVRNHGNPQFNTYIPPEFIADMVGLTTNVTEVSHADFMKNVRRWLEDDAAATYRAYTARVDEAAREAEVEASIAEHEVRIAEEDS